MRNKTTVFFIFALLGLGLIESTKAGKNRLGLTWDEVVELEETAKKEIIEFHKEELNRFLDDIGFRESGNRYHVTNELGYMGKYQFGKSTLRALGFNVTRNEFLNNPELQEDAMMELLLHNKEMLQPYIDIYDGKTIHGITITESGILAAAHLGGEASVRRFLKNGKVFKDGNGTKITSYIKQFSGYQIKL